MPLQEHFHPNQHNHFLGPLAHHDQHMEQQLPDLNIDNPELQLQIALPDNAELEEEEENEEEMPGWGHRALPQQANLVDQELHPSEFMELNDLMAPLQEQEALIIQENVHPAGDQSNITLSLVATNQFVPSVESANGPPQPIFNGLPYLNLLDGPPVHQPPHVPVDGPMQLPNLQMPDMEQAPLPPITAIDHNMEAILSQNQMERAGTFADPMQFEMIHTVSDLKQTTVAKPQQVEADHQLVISQTMPPTDRVDTANQQDNLLECENADSELSTPWFP